MVEDELPMLVVCVERTACSTKTTSMGISFSTICIFRIQPGCQPAPSSKRGLDTQADSYSHWQRWQIDISDPTEPIDFSDTRSVAAAAAVMALDTGRSIEEVHQSGKGEWVGSSRSKLDRP